MRFDIFAPDEFDYDELREVWQSSVDATHGFVSRDDLAFYRTQLTNELFEQHTMIALKTPVGNIVGFAGINDGELNMLFVHADYRGQGVGKRLLTYAIDKLGARKLDVNTQNNHAAEFYRRLGFVATGESPLDGYGRPYPLTHMKLQVAKN